MQTQLTYFDDSYQFSSFSILTSFAHDENGPYITLDSTIFYPQGGGQPTDVGTIDVEGHVIDIVMVRWAQDQVRHYTKQACGNFVGKRASLKIDEQKRRLYARLHTAGHLLSHAVETLYPHWKAVKGHHYQESPYVEFVSEGYSVGENASLVSLEAVNKEIERLVAKQYPIEAMIVSPEQFQVLCPRSSYFNSNLPIRLVRIGEFPYQPCGGTHVKNVKELSGLSAIKQKIKGNTLRITYQIHDSGRTF